MSVAKADPILSLKGVNKTYIQNGDSTNVLCDINLDIFPGEFVSILGPSGSGKSTLMHIMSFLDSPSSGEVLLNGKALKTLSEAERAKIRNKTIGFIFQQFNLLNRTNSVENVGLPLIYSEIGDSERKERSIELLKAVGLGDKLSNRPSQLSGGQQQRVAIARALVNNPQIVFADEPTGNLDSRSGEEIMGLLQKLNQEGRTIVLVTHEQEVADYAKRQIYIRDGQITSDTVPLKRKNALK